jgi:hypothetical protein
LYTHTHKIHSRLIKEKEKRKSDKKTEVKKKRERGVG